VKHAVAAERAGFDGVLVSDHFHPWVDDAGASGFACPPWAIAQATERVRLCTAVISPLFRFHRRRWWPRRPPPWIDCPVAASSWAWAPGRT